VSTGNADEESPQAAKPGIALTDIAKVIDDPAAEPHAIMQRKSQRGRVRKLSKAQPTAGS
jgi:hypothetical protein